MNYLSVTTDVELANRVIRQGRVESILSDVVWDVWV